MNIKNIGLMILTVLSVQPAMASIENIESGGGALL